MSENVILRSSQSSFLWLRSSDPLPPAGIRSVQDSDLVMIDTDLSSIPQILRFVIPARILTILSSPIVLTKLEIDWKGSRIMPCASIVTTLPPSPMLITRIIISLNDHRGNIKYIDQSFPMADNMTTLTLGFHRPMIIESSDQVINFYFFHSDCQNLIVIPEMIFHYLSPMPSPPEPSPPQPPYPFPSLVPVPTTIPPSTMSPQSRQVWVGLGIICLTFLLLLIIMIT